MKLIIGLGNEEPDYSNTRHNVGKDILNLFVKTIPDATFKEDKNFKADILKLSNGSILVKPKVNMNISGEVVSKLVNFYKTPLENLMIIYDELDLLVGEYKLAVSKGSKIHNGISSVYDHLKSKDFYHLRIGVRDESIPMSVQKEGIDPKKYVLEKLSITDRNKLIFLFENTLVNELLTFLNTK